MFLLHLLLLLIQLLLLLLLACRLWCLLFVRAAGALLRAAAVSSTSLQMPLLLHTPEHSSCSQPSLLRAQLQADQTSKPVAATAAAAAAVAAAAALRAATPTACEKMQQTLQQKPGCASSVPCCCACAMFRSLPEQLQQQRIRLTGGQQPQLRQQQQHLVQQPLPRPATGEIKDLWTFLATFSKLAATALAAAAAAAVSPTGPSGC